MVQTVQHKEILIPSNRQRREKKPEYLIELATSISRNGLFHPPVVRVNESGQMLLVAGECRLEAIHYLWEMGEALRYGGVFYCEGQVPVNFLGELDPVDAYEIELEENIRRLDLSWQERADATASLFKLRSMQAERDSKPIPTVAEVAAEVRGESGSAQDTTRKELLVSRHMGDVDVAKAKSLDDAFKVLKRKEELKRSAQLATSVGKTFTASTHSLIQGDCLSELAGFMPDSFDVVLTDPPYGINAQDFNNSGKLVSGTHFYDDSPEEWTRLMKAFLPEVCRITKPEAHFYMFCDVDNFWHAKQLMTWAAMETKTDWRVFRTPLIWINPTAMRAPWPEHGPQRKWQMVLYAIKGNKKAIKLSPDVLTFPSDENLNHHAQKPVALYMELLSRSVRAGDSVIDPFAGSGPIFPAAHAIKVRATGIELDPAAAGIAAQRIKELK